MKLKLLNAAASLLLFLIPLHGLSQTIGTPVITSAGGPIQISFEVTNGTATQIFTAATNYTVYLTDASGSNPVSIYSFNSATFPAPIANASATIDKVVPVPAGTLQGNNYRLYVTSAAPVSSSQPANFSEPFSLAASFVVPATLSGYIKCSSPSINYYVITITNTGNLIDSYSLSKTQSLYPLTSQFLSLTGSPISTTPSLDPGESYTFMMRFDTPNGTPPDNWSTTIVTYTSNTYQITQTTSISTYIYCGNNNQNIPNAPDMQITKTASTATATVGDYIDYTITIKNNTTKNANNPVIKDFLPSNAQLISYSKAAGETRNVVFSVDTNANTLTAVVQSTMINSSLPLTINVRVRTYCQSVPAVVNSAEVYTASGDNYAQNDTASASTAVTFNLSAGAVGTWTGAFSSDWFDCRNWAGGVVPNNNTNVVLPPSTPLSQISKLSPLAPADKTARCHNISISNNAILKMVDGGLLSVAGNWSSMGTFQYGNGTVFFNGFTPSAYQTVYDAAGRSEFYNLTVNTSSGAKGVLISEGYGLFVHNNLDLLNGNIRMSELSQLIQTKTGTNGNSTSGSGQLLIDQKGQSNVFSYNYWSSPVGSNNSYTVGNVLRDGTDISNPLPINWTSGYNGSPTTPITMSSYRINKFQNQTATYASWSQIGPLGVLSAGQGFTMKGSGAATPLQNYTFEGKPNNGVFTSAVSPNNMNLCGNPYPSALDAYSFIDDNLATTTGTLYFWEQFSTNSSHITANYEGGYATLTKTGATPPAAPVGVSSAGSSTRLPGRYIPVAQGFLLFGSNAGGTINFANSQRAFVRETDAGSNPMFKNDDLANDGKVRVRIGLHCSASGAKRQLLLGFMDEAGTPGFDKGYDGIQVDPQVTDIFFPLNDEKLVIQALGAFSDAAMIPIGVEVNDAQTLTFTLDGSENLTASSRVLLFDSEMSQSYDLSKGEKSLTLPAGSYANRFFLKFGAGSAHTAAHRDNPVVLSTDGMLRIGNVPQNARKVILHGFNGGQIASWEISNATSELQFNLPGVAAGLYVATLECAGSSYSTQIYIPR